MKKSVAVSLFIFWAIVVAILTAGLVFYNQNGNVSVVNNIASTTLPVNSATVTNDASLAPVTRPLAKPVVKANKKITPTPATNQATLTASEVAKHNTANDCWQIINGNVYNLTSLINTHSGGAQAILQTCGQDGSAGFNTKYGQGSHSSSAQNILQSFLIGPLGQAVNSSPNFNSPGATQANPVAPVTNSRGENDD